MDNAVFRKEHFMSTRPSIRRAWLRCAAIFALAGACADDGVVGENDGSGAPAGDSESAAPSSCQDRHMLQTLPATEVNYSESPALWVEGARGTWSNAKGDVLEIAIDQANTRVAFTCDDNSNIPGPAGPRPHVSFELTGELALHTADGAWDERVEVKYSLAPGPAGTPFSMMLRGLGGLALSMLHGTFSFPPDLPVKPADSVTLIVEYQSGGWVLRRIAAKAPPNPGTMSGTGCGCGDIAPAWQGEQLVFVRP
jgi:hypothetical protein